LLRAQAVIAASAASAQLRSGAELAEASREPPKHMIQAPNMSTAG
jgi:hypothetical protein